MHLAADLDRTGLSLLECVCDSVLWRRI